MRWSVFALAACLAGCGGNPVVVNVTIPGQPQNEAPDMSVTQVISQPRNGVIILTQASGLMTSTMGEHATFKVTLSLAPSSPVTVDVTSSDTSQGAVNPSRLTFNQFDFDEPQSVTVTGVDDHVQNGNHAYQVTLTADSSDPAYLNETAVVTLTNIEITPPGFVVAPTQGLTATFGVSTATFNVSLATAPTANVTIGLTSSSASIGTASPASLTFTPANFSMKQAVTVTAVDDHIQDGNQVVSAVFGASASADANYNGLTPAPVSVTAIETDVAGITVAPTSGLNTTKAGATAQFTVHLNTQPTASVSIGLSSSNTTEGTVSPSSLTFTTANWNSAQTVTVTGVNDNKVTGNTAYSVITAPAVSTDTVYSGMNASDVSLTNIDTNSATIILSRTSGLQTNENGSSDTFTIKLSTNPAANVTIGLSVDNTNLGSVSPSSVVFTSANGTTAQTVTVSGVADAKGNTAVDGNQTYHVVTAAASSGDGNYNGLNPSDVTVTSIDDDVYVYGSNTNPNSMTWCYPTTATCACDPATQTCAPINTLTVNLPFRGGSANFVLGVAGAVHGVYSTAASPEFAQSPQLTVIGGGPPYPVTLGPGTHNFACWIHGTVMSGNLVVP